MEVPDSPDDPRLTPPASQSIPSINSRGDSKAPINDPQTAVALEDNQLIGVLRLKNVDLRARTAASSRKNQADSGSNLLQPHRTKFTDRSGGFSEAGDQQVEDHTVDPRDPHPPGPSKHGPSVPQPSSERIKETGLRVGKGVRGTPTAFEDTGIAVTRTQTKGEIDGTVTTRVGRT
jgi:hypothetical protein